METLQIKKCQLSDLEELIDISRTTFIEAFEKDNNPVDFQNYIGSAFSMDTMTRELTSTGAHFYFGYLEGKLVGYFRLNETPVQSDLNDPESIELERIYIRPEFQGKGLGLRFINEIIELCRGFGAKYIWLGVWEHNPGAIRFYERIGFIKFGQHPYVLGTDVQTDWLMRLDI